MSAAGSGRPAHALTKTEHDAVFRSRVIPEVLATGRSGRPRPPVPLSRQLQVTIFGGRPGSGKSMTRNAVAQLLQPDAAERSRALLARLHEPDSTGKPACYVRIIWVSTAQAMADLGVLDRYRQERAAFGGGRFVADPDRSYPGVLATARGMPGPRRSQRPADDLVPLQDSSHTA
jgi:hypothetical protein